MKDDRGPNDLEQQLENKDILISKLHQKITDLMAINESHNFTLANQVETNKNLEIKMKELNKQVSDFYHVR